MNTNQFSSFLHKFAQKLLKCTLWKLYFYNLFSFFLLNPLILFVSFDLPPGKTKSWWWWAACVPSSTAQLHLSCFWFTAWWQTLLWHMSWRYKSWKIQTRNAVTTPFIGPTAPYMKQLTTTQWTVGKSQVYCLDDWCCSQEFLLNIFSFYRVDIEAQMTLFAYYYIGIGLGVLIVSYFQVRMCFNHKKNLLIYDGL